MLLSYQTERARRRQTQRGPAARFPTKLRTFFPALVMARLGTANTRTAARTKEAGCMGKTPEARGVSPALAFLGGRGC